MSLAPQLEPHRVCTEPGISSVTGTAAEQGPHTEDRQLPMGLQVALGSWFVPPSASLTPLNGGSE